MGISPSKENLEYIARRLKEGTVMMVERYTQPPSMAEINDLQKRAIFQNLCIVIVIGHHAVEKAELAKFHGKPPGVYIYGR